MEFKIIIFYSKLALSEEDNNFVAYFLREGCKIIEQEKQKLSIQRFKGLGEMNPEELWQTTLNPDNRNLLKVQYSNGTKEKSKEDQKIISILMGDEVAPRREFITSNALDVANLDI